MTDEQRTIERLVDALRPMALMASHYDTVPAGMAEETVVVTVQSLDGNDMVDVKITVADLWTAAEEVERVARMPFADVAIRAAVRSAGADVR